MSAGQGAPARPDRATLAAFVAVVLLGGANVIGVRQTVLELAPLWGASMRFAIAGLLMGLVVLALRRRFPAGRSLAGAVLYGLLAFAGAYGFLYLGLVEAPAMSTVLISLTPLLTFAFAIAHGQERFHARGLAGALIALVGVAIVFLDQLSLDVPIASLVLLLLGTICIAESAVIVKWIPRSDPFGTNAVAMVTGAVVLLGLSAAAGEARALPQQGATWLAVGYLVLLGSVAMFALYLFALARWTASAMSYVTLLFPIATVILAVALLGEQVTPALLLGGAVVLAGVYVGVFSRSRVGRSTATSAPECLPIDDCPPLPTVRATDVEAPART